MTGALHELSLQISSAKVSTYGERVVDVFYVKNVFGMKVDHPEKLQQINDKLYSVFQMPACAPAKPDAPAVARSSVSAVKTTVSAK